MNKNLLTLICVCSFLATGCSQKSEPIADDRESSLKAKTFRAFENSKPDEIMVSLKKYLEFEKGFGISILDADRGFLVTEWIQDEPLQRMQMTFRINEHQGGSLMSVFQHREVRESATRWVEQVSTGRAEERFLNEFSQYIRATSQNRLK